VLLQHLNFVRRRFGKLCSIFIGRVRMTNVDETECSEMLAHKIKTPKESPKRKNTASATWRKSEIKNVSSLSHAVSQLTLPCTTVATVTLNSMYTGWSYISIDRNVSWKKKTQQIDACLTCIRSCSCNALDSQLIGSHYASCYITGCLGKLASPVR